VDRVATEKVYDVTQSNILPYFSFHQIYNS
jgi:hypothetical protein